MSHSPPICPIDQGPSNRHHWCTFQVSDRSTAIIEYAYGFFLIIILFVIVRYMCLLHRYKSNTRYKDYFGRIYVWVYWFVALWLFCSIMRVGCSITAYHQYMEADFVNGQVPEVDDPDIKSPIVILSMVYNYFSVTSAFMISLLMILIPYQWIKIAVQIIKQSHQIDRKSQKWILRWIKILQIVRYYCKYVRNLFPMFLTVETIMFFFTSTGRCSLIIVSFYFLASQAVVVILFYIFVAFAMKYLENRQLIKLHQMQSIRIKVQYLLLTLVLIIRCLKNFLTTSPQTIPTHYSPNGNCSNKGYQQNTVLLILLCIHHIFLHLLPIVIIMYIYEPNVNKFKRYESLLDIDTTSDTEAEFNYKAIARSFHGSSLITVNSREDVGGLRVEYS